MSATLEHAREGLEHAQEAAKAHGHGDGFARWVAVLISVLAASLALIEMQEKSSQNQYVARHIQVSDDYAFYQAKTLRQTLYKLHGEQLGLLSNTADPAVQKQIEATKAEVARLEDDPKSNGRKQLLEKAKADEETREVFLHRYELFEMVVGVLQIAIVLASVSIVTRVKTLAYVGGVFGIGAIVAGGLVFFSIL